tara:strand:- start:38 stop:205 length:168 start_codon:yes stop_codon:yes gene_type:complete
MFIIKNNNSYAITLAGTDDIKLLDQIGSSGIAKLCNGRAILSRLVNSGYISEGIY